MVQHIGVMLVGEEFRIGWVQRSKEDKDGALQNVGGVHTQELVATLDPEKSLGIICQGNVSIDIYEFTN